MSRTPPDPAFEADGSLRDIYVAPVGLRDWQEALTYLRAHGQAVQFTLSGMLHTLPAATDELFAFRPAREPLLRFQVAGISIACHFFNPAELELDLVPNTVRSAEQVSALRSFLSGLASALGKEVRLTRENLREEVLWRVSSASRAASSV